MADPRPNVTPIDPIERRFQAIETKLAELRSPTGTQKFQAVGNIEATLAYLTGLQTRAAGGQPPLITGTVANDALDHWFATSPDTQIAGFLCPTGKMTVEASVGEASLTPGGSFVIGYVSYNVRDANNVDIPGAGLAANRGRFYTNQRSGLSISTGPQLVTIPSQITYPPPYKIRAFIGMWVAAANTTPCSAVFTDVSLVAEVIGEGVY